MSLTIGPMDTTVADDDIISTFSSNVNQDHILSQIELLEKENTSNLKNYEEILNVTINSSYSDEEINENIDSKTANKIIEFLLTLKSDDINPDDKDSKTKRPDVIDQISQSYKYGYLEQQKLLRIQKYIELKRYATLQKIENFNKKLKVLSLKLLVIGGKIAFKAVLSTSMNVFLLPWLCNSIHLLDKNSLDTAMLILESCGLVPVHEIQRIYESAESVANQFFIFAQSNLESLVDNNNYFNLGEIKFMNLSELNKNPEHKKQILELWEKFTNVKYQEKDVNIFRLISQIFNDGFKKIKVDEPEDDDGKIALLNKYLEGEIGRAPLSNLDEIVKKQLHPLLGILDNFDFLIDQNEEKNKDNLLQTIKKCLSQREPSENITFFDKIFEEQNKDVGEGKKQFSYYVSPNEEMKLMQSQIRTENDESWMESRVGLSGGGLLGLAQNLFETFDYQGSMIGLVHTAINSDFNEILSDAAGVFIFTDSTIPENSGEIYLKNEIKNNLKSITRSGYLRELIDDNWSNFVTSFRIPSHITQNIFGNTNIEIPTFFTDVNSHVGNFMENLDLSAGSTVSYGLDLLIDKFVYVPPPPSEKVNNYDKKLQILDDRINFRKKLYDKGLKEEDVDELFDEKYDSENAYQSILGKSINKVYKTGSFKSMKSITKNVLGLGAACTLTSFLTSVILDPANTEALRDLGISLAANLKGIEKNLDSVPFAQAAIYHAYQWIFNGTKKSLDFLKTKFLPWWKKEKVKAEKKDKEEQLLKDTEKEILKKAYEEKLKKWNDRRKKREEELNDTWTGDEGQKNDFVQNGLNQFEKDNQKPSKPKESSDELGNLFQDFREIVKSLQKNNYNILEKLASFGVKLVKILCPGCETILGLIWIWIFGFGKETIGFNYDSVVIIIKRMRDIFLASGSSVSEDSKIFHIPKRQIIDLIYKNVIKLQNEINKMLSDIVTFVRNNMPYASNDEQNYVINKLFNNRLVKTLTEFTLWGANTFSQYLVNEGLTKEFNNLENYILHFNTEKFVREFNINKFRELVIIANEKIPFSFLHGFQRGNSEENVVTAATAAIFQQYSEQHTRVSTNPYIGEWTMKKYEGEFEPPWALDIFDIFFGLWSATYTLFYKYGFQMPTFPGQPPDPNRRIVPTYTRHREKLMRRSRPFCWICGPPNCPSDDNSWQDWENGQKNGICSKFDILSYLGYIMTFFNYKSYDEDTKEALSKNVSGERDRFIVAAHEGKILTIEQNEEDFLRNNNNRQILKNLLMEFITTNRSKYDPSSKEYKLLDQDLQTLKTSGKKFGDILILNPYAAINDEIDICLKLKMEFQELLQSVLNREQSEIPTGMLSTTGYFIRQLNTLTSKDTDVLSNFQSEFIPYFQSLNPEELSNHLADRNLLIQLGRVDEDKSMLFKQGAKAVVIPDSFMTDVTEPTSSVPKRTPLNKNIESDEYNEYTSWKDSNKDGDNVIFMEISVDSVSFFDYKLAKNWVTKQKQSTQSDPYVEKDEFSVEGRIEKRLQQVSDLKKELIQAKQNLDRAMSTNDDQLISEKLKELCGKVDKAIKADVFCKELDECIKAQIELLEKQIKIADQDYDSIRLLVNKLSYVVEYHCKESDFKGVELYRAKKLILSKLRLHHPNRPYPDNWNHDLNPDSEVYAEQKKDLIESREKLIRQKEIKKLSNQIYKLNNKSNRTDKEEVLLDKLKKEYFELTQNEYKEADLPNIDIMYNNAIDRLMNLIASSRKIGFLGEELTKAQELAKEIIYLDLKDGKVEWDKYKTQETLKDEKDGLNQVRLDDVKSFIKQLCQYNQRQTSEQNKRYIKIKLSKFSQEKMVEMLGGYTSSCVEFIDNETPYDETDHFEFKKGTNKREGQLKSFSPIDLGKFFYDEERIQLERLEFDNAGRERIILLRKIGKFFDYKGDKKVTFFDTPVKFSELPTTQWTTPDIESEDITSRSNNDINLTEKMDKLESLKDKLDLLETKVEFNYLKSRIKILRRKIDQQLSSARNLNDKDLKVSKDFDLTEDRRISGDYLGPFNSVSKILLTRNNRNLWIKEDLGYTENFSIDDNMKNLIKECLPNSKFPSVHNELVLITLCMNPEFITCLNDNTNPKYIKSRNDLKSHLIKLSNDIFLETSGPRFCLDDGNIKIETTDGTCNEEFDDFSYHIISKNIASYTFKKIIELVTSKRKEKINFTKSEDEFKLKYYCSISDKEEKMKFIKDYKFDVKTDCSSSSEDVPIYYGSDSRLRFLSINYLESKILDCTQQGCPYITQLLNRISNTNIGYSTKNWKTKFNEKMKRALGIDEDLYMLEISDLVKKLFMTDQEQDEFNSNFDDDVFKTKIKPLPIKENEFITWFSHEDMNNWFDHLDQLHKKVVLMAKNRGIKSIQCSNQDDKSIEEILLRNQSLRNELASIGNENLKREKLTQIFKLTNDIRDCLIDTMSTFFLEDQRYNARNSGNHQDLLGLRLEESKLGGFSRKLLYKEIITFLKNVKELVKKPKKPRKGRVIPRVHAPPLKNIAKDIAKDSREAQTQTVTSTQVGPQQMVKEETSETQEQSEETEVTEDQTEEEGIEDIIREAERLAEQLDQQLDTALSSSLDISEKMDNAIMESLRNKLKNMFDSFGGILSSLRTGGGFRKTEEDFDYNEEYLDDDPENLTPEQERVINSQCLLLQKHWMPGGGELSNESPNFIYNSSELRPNQIKFIKNNCIGNNIRNNEKNFTFSLSIQDEIIGNKFRQLFMGRGDVFLGKADMLKLAYDFVVENGLNSFAMASSVNTFELLYPSFTNIFTTWLVAYIAIEGSNFLTVLYQILKANLVGINPRIVGQILMCLAKSSFGGPAGFLGLLLCLNGIIGLVTNLLAPAVIIHHYYTVASRLLNERLKMATMMGKIFQKNRIQLGKYNKINKLYNRIFRPKSIKYSDLQQNKFLFNNVEYDKNNITKIRLNDCAEKQSDGLWKFKNSSQRSDNCQENLEEKQFLEGEILRGCENLEGSEEIFIESRKKDREILQKHYVDPTNDRVINETIEEYYYISDLNQDSEVSILNNTDEDLSLEDIVEKMDPEKINFLGETEEEQSKELKLRRLLLIELYNVIGSEDLQQLYEFSDHDSLMTVDDNMNRNNKRNIRGQIDTVVKKLWGKTYSELKNNRVPQFDKSKILSLQHQQSVGNYKFNLDKSLSFNLKDSIEIKTKLLKEVDLEKGSLNNYMTIDKINVEYKLKLLERLTKNDSEVNSYYGDQSIIHVIIENMKQESDSENDYIQNRDKDFDDELQKYLNDDNVYIADLINENMIDSIQEKERFIREFICNQYKIMTTRRSYRKPVSNIIENTLGFNVSEGPYGVKDFKGEDLASRTDRLTQSEQSCREGNEHCRDDTYCSIITHEEYLNADGSQDSKIRDISKQMFKPTVEFIEHIREGEVIKKWRDSDSEFNEREKLFSTLKDSEKNTFKNHFTKYSNLWKIYACKEFYAKLHNHDQNMNDVKLNRHLVRIPRIADHADDIRNGTFKNSKIAIKNLFIRNCKNIKIDDTNSNQFNIPIDDETPMFFDEQKIDDPDKAPGQHLLKSYENLLNEIEKDKLIQCYEDFFQQDIPNNINLDSSKNLEVKYLDLIIYDLNLPITSADIIGSNSILTKEQKLQIYKYYMPWQHIDPWGGVTENERSGYYKSATDNNNFKHHGNIAEMHKINGFYFNKCLENKQLRPIPGIDHYYSNDGNFEKKSLNRSPEKISEYLSSLQRGSLLNDDDDDNIYYKWLETLKTDYLFKYNNGKFEWNTEPIDLQSEDHNHYSVWKDIIEEANTFIFNENSIQNIINQFQNSENIPIFDDTIQPTQKEIDGEIKLFKNKNNNTEILAYYWNENKWNILTDEADNNWVIQDIYDIPVSHVISKKYYSGYSSDNYVKLGCFKEEVHQLTNVEKNFSQNYRICDSKNQSMKNIYSKEYKICKEKELFIKLIQGKIPFVVYRTLSDLDIKTSIENSPMSMFEYCNFSDKPKHEICLQTKSQMSTIKSELIRKLANKDLYSRLKHFVDKKKEKTVMTYDKRGNLSSKDPISLQIHWTEQEDDELIFLPTVSTTLKDESVEGMVINKQDQSENIHPIDNVLNTLVTEIIESYLIVSNDEGDNTLTQECKNKVLKEINKQIMEYLTTNVTLNLKIDNNLCINENEKSIINSQLPKINKFLKLIFFGKNQDGHLDEFANNLKKLVTSEKDKQSNEKLLKFIYIIDLCSRRHVKEINAKIGNKSTMLILQQWVNNEGKVDFENWKQDLLSSSNNNIFSNLSKELLFLITSYSNGQKLKTFNYNDPTLVERSVQIQFANTTSPIEYNGRFEDNITTENKKIFKKFGYYFDTNGRLSKLESWKADVYPPVIQIPKHSQISVDTTHYFKLDKIHPDCYSIPSQKINICYIDNIFCQLMPLLDTKNFYFHKSILENENLVKLLNIKLNENKFNVDKPAQFISEDSNSDYCQQYSKLRLFDIHQLNKNLHVKIEGITPKPEIIISNNIGNTPIIIGLETGQQCSNDLDCQSKMCRPKNENDSDKYCCNIDNSEGCIYCDDKGDCAGCDKENYKEIIQIIDGKRVISCEPKLKMIDVYECVEINNSKVCVQKRIKAVDKTTSQYLTLENCKRMCTDTDSDLGDNPDSDSPGGTTPTTTISDDDTPIPDNQPEIEPIEWEGKITFKLNDELQTYLTSLDGLSGVEISIYHEKDKDKDIITHKINNDSLGADIPIIVDKYTEDYKLQDDGKKAYTSVSEKQKNLKLSAVYIKDGIQKKLNINVKLNLSDSDKSITTLKIDPFMNVRDEHLSIPYLIYTNKDEIFEYSNTQPSNIEISLIPPPENCQEVHKSGVCLKCKKGYRHFIPKDSNIPECKLLDQDAENNPWKIFFPSTIISLLESLEILDKGKIINPRTSTNVGDTKLNLNTETIVNSLDIWKNQVKQIAKEDLENIKKMRECRSGNCQDTITLKEKEINDFICEKEWLLLTGLIDENHIWNYEEISNKDINVVSNKSDIDNYVKLRGLKFNLPEIKLSETVKQSPNNEFTFMKLLDTNLDGKITKDSFCKLLLDSPPPTTTSINHEIIYSALQYFYDSSNKSDFSKVDISANIKRMKSEIIFNPRDFSDSTSNSTLTTILNLLFSQSDDPEKYAQNESNAWYVALGSAKKDTTLSSIFDGSIIYIPDKVDIKKALIRQNIHTNSKYDNLIITDELNKTLSEDINNLADYHKSEFDKIEVKKNINITFNHDSEKRCFKMVSNIIYSDNPIWFDERNSNYLYYNKESSQWHIGTREQMNEKSVLTKLYLPIKRQAQINENKSAIDFLYDSSSKWAVETWNEGEPPTLTTINFYNPTIELSGNTQEFYEIDNKEKGIIFGDNPSIQYKQYIDIQIQREEFFNRLNSNIRLVELRVNSKIDECRNKLSNSLEKLCSVNQSWEAELGIETNSGIQKELDYYKKSTFLEKDTKEINNVIKKRISVFLKHIEKKMKTSKISVLKKGLDKFAEETTKKIKTIGLGANEGSIIDEYNKCLNEAVFKAKNKVEEIKKIRLAVNKKYEGAFLKGANKHILKEIYKGYEKVFFEKIKIFDIPTYEDLLSNGLTFKGENISSIKTLDLDEHKRSIKLNQLKPNDYVIYRSYRRKRLLAEGSEAKLARIESISDKNYVISFPNSENPVMEIPKTRILDRDNPNWRSVSNKYDSYMIYKEDLYDNENSEKLQDTIWENVLSEVDSPTLRQLDRAVGFNWLGHEISSANTIFIKRHLSKIFTEALSKCQGNKLTCVEKVTEELKDLLKKDKSSLIMRSFDQYGSEISWSYSDTDYRQFKTKLMIVFNQSCSNNITKKCLQKLFDDEYATFLSKFKAQLGEKMHSLLTQSNSFKDLVTNFLEEESSLDIDKLNKKIYVYLLDQNNIKVNQPSSDGNILGDVKLFLPKKTNVREKYNWDPITSSDIFEEQAELYLEELKLYTDLLDTKSYIENMVRVINFNLGSEYLECSKKLNKSFNKNKKPIKRLFSELNNFIGDKPNKTQIERLKLLKPDELTTIDNYNASVDTKTDLNSLYKNNIIELNKFLVNYRKNIIQKENDIKCHDQYVQYHSRKKTLEKRLDLMKECMEELHLCIKYSSLEQIGDDKKKDFLNKIINSKTDQINREMQEQNGLDNVMNNIIDPIINNLSTSEHLELNFKTNLEKILNLNYNLYIANDDSHGNKITNCSDSKHNISNSDFQIKKEENDLITDSEILYPLHHLINDKFNNLLTQKNQFVKAGDLSLKDFDFSKHFKTKVEFIHESMKTVNLLYHPVTGILQKTFYTLKSNYDDFLKESKNHPKGEIFKNNVYKLQNTDLGKKLFENVSLDLDTDFLLQNLRSTIGAAKPTDNLGVESDLGKILDYIAGKYTLETVKEQFDIALNKELTVALPIISESIQLQNALLRKLKETQSGGNKSNQKFTKINKILKKRSLRKNIQSRNYIRMSKAKSFKKKSKSKINNSKSKAKQVNNLLKKRSLRKNKQNKKHIDLDSVSS